jgi:oxazoline/thiazoline synthase
MPHDGTVLSESIDRLYQIDVGNGCPFHIAAAILRPDPWGRRRVVSGRGFDADEAARNCMFEASERQSAVFDERRRMVRATARDLAGSAVRPQQLLLISEAQYAGRRDWNAAVTADHHLPAPFNDDAKINWVEARSLLTGDVTHVPAACCFLGYPLAQQEGFPVPDSSGLAAGATIEDAIERALCECVERDAVAIWWYNRIQLPSPALAVPDGGIWQSYAAWLARCGRTFWLLDLSHDLALPVVAAISCDADGSDLALGFGCALCPQAAAIQAMGELVQFDVSKRNFTTAEASPYPDLVSWCRTARIKEFPFLAPNTTRAPTTRPAIAGQALQTSLAHAGLSPLAVDLSNTGRPSHVTRVLVPGLRSIWPRYAAGRLYDVPPALGWQKKPLGESELNPIPMLY